MAIDPGKKELYDIVTGRYNFKVPDYQRNYSWEIDELEDLWRDLHTVIDAEEKPHFFGTILLRGKSERGVYDIIDGQQRMATIQILLNEMAKKWKEYKEGYGENLRRNYIAPEEGYRVSLMGDDKRLFKERILGGVDWEPDNSLDDGTPSKTRLLEAKKFFREKLKEKEEAIGDISEESEAEDAGGGEKFVEYLQSLKDTIDGLELMTYTVESESEAVRIFEVVNDRGRQLTDLERTKSFLMHQLYLSISDDDEKELEERLGTIRDRFNDIYKLIDYSSQIRGRNLGEDAIQRHHYILWDEKWGRTQNPRYQNHLDNLKQEFRQIPDGDDKVQDIMEYTRELRASFRSIYELQSISADDEEVEKRVRRLIVLGTLGNFYPLLIASWIRYDHEEEYAPEEYAKLLDRVETYIFRIYSMDVYNSNMRRRDFYDLARDVYQGEKTVSEATQEVDKYINSDCDDERLLSILQDNNNNKSDLRYLLYFYEVHLEKEINLDLEETVKGTSDEHDITIEHIWPQDPSRLGLTEEEISELHEPNIDRLGNLALMTWSWNSSEQNQAFKDKRERYMESKIRMLNEVAEREKRSEWGDPDWDVNEWGVEQIEMREKKILDFVLERWPDPLSSGTDVDAERE